MYSMNWVTYSFMRARHVSMQGTLRGGGGGGGFVAIAHVLQWCRLPRLFQAHHSRSERLNQCSVSSYVGQDCDVVTKRCHHILGLCHQSTDGFPQ